MKTFMCRADRKYRIFALINFIIFININGSNYRKCTLCGTLHGGHNSLVLPLPGID